MRASVGNGGWVALSSASLPGVLYVRFGGTDDTGRLRVTEFYLDASENRDTAILEDDLGSFPLTAIEAVINEEMTDEVRRRIHVPSPDLSTLASYFATSYGNYEREIDERNWVAISFASQIDSAARNQANLPKIESTPEKNPHAVIREIDQNFRLTPDMRPADGLTNQFLEQVARAYRAAMLRGERPNLSISKQLNYPLKTVQRWVYTARQRRIMGPGNKGRAG